MRNKKFILTAIAALGLCFSVGAATGVKISAELKKQVINVGGKESTNEVIAYEGTTYVPLRQVGNMLGAKVEYKDGVIYLGEEKVETGWVPVETENVAAFQNEKLGAGYSILESEYADKSAEEFLKDVVPKLEGIKHSELIKVAGYDVVYTEAFVDGTNQLEAYIYYEAEDIDGVKVYPTDCIVMYKLDNSDPAKLKSALIAVVESFLE